jgi:hypothetical protein
MGFKTLGYCLVAYSLYRFYLDLDAIPLVFTALGAYVCGGIRINLDGLSFCVLLAGVYFCVHQQFMLGSGLIVLAVLLSRYSTRRGDWAEALWDLDSSLSDTKKAECSSGGFDGFGDWLYNFRVILYFYLNL